MGRLHASTLVKQVGIQVRLPGISCADSWRWTEASITLQSRKRLLDQPPAGRVPQDLFANDGLVRDKAVCIALCNLRDGSGGRYCPLA
jgi:hypothetical protein